MVKCTLKVSTNTKDNPIGLRIHNDNQVVVDRLVDADEISIDFCLVDTQVPNITSSSIDIEIYGKNDSHCVGDATEHGHVVIEQLTVGGAKLIDEINQHYYQHIIDNITYNYEGNTTTYTTVLGHNGVVSIPIVKPVYYWIATDLLVV
jgi:hypothetical protein